MVRVSRRVKQKICQHDAVNAFNQITTQNVCAQSNRRTVYLHTDQSVCTQVNLLTGSLTLKCHVIIFNFLAQSGADYVKRCAIMVFFTHHTHCVQCCGVTEHKQQSCQSEPFCVRSSQRIQTLLALCSEFFSLFPQGIGLLPVSSLYLSLHETHHPLSTPFPKSVILKMHTVHGGAHDGRQECHPNCCSVPRGMHPGPRWQCISTLHVKARCLDYKNEPCHVHSQLLLIFHLVQVPLPTYMLKFSRSASQAARPELIVSMAESSTCVHGSLSQTS